MSSVSLLQIYMFSVLLVSGITYCAGAKLLPDYSISTKCSKVLNDSNNQRIAKNGEILHFFFIPMVMGCEGSLCTEAYKARCNPTKCPKCKLYSGPVNRLLAQIESVDGNSVVNTCIIKKSFSIYSVTCMPTNEKLIGNYVLKIYGQQMNGTKTLVNYETTISYQAGADISIVNSGPGFWPNGSVLAVGVLSTFTFPVKDRFDTVLNETTGVATLADIEDAFGHLDYQYSLNINSYSIEYDKVTGYATVSFIPTKLGNWSLFIGQTEKGFILDSPYVYDVVTSEGPTSASNCLAVWSSGTENILKAGDIGYVTIYLRDLYNNSVDISTGWSDVVNFTTIVTTEKGEAESGERCEDCSSLTAVPGAGYEKVAINVTTPGLYKLVISDGEDLVEGSPLNFTVVAGSFSIQNSIASWVNDTNTFRAGDEAALRILLKDSFNNTMTVSTGKAFDGFNVFSNSSTGEVSYDGFSVSFDSNPAYERISFIPKRVGDYNLHVNHNNKDADGSPLDFSVTAGPISIPNCKGSWLNNSNNFAAGKEAILQIFLMDLYNNNVSSNQANFTFFASIWDSNSKRAPIKLQQEYDANSSSQLIRFNTSKAGDMLLSVGTNTSLSVIGSPFSFHVIPGDIFPSFCRGFWMANMSTFNVGKQAIFNVMYKDFYNNSLNKPNISTISLTATIETRDSIGNFTTLNINSVNNAGFGTIDFVSFSSGVFALHVMVKSINISGSPFIFETLPGEIYPKNCRGAWLSGNNTFEAGTYCVFKIYMFDMYNNTVYGDSVGDGFNVYAMNDQGQNEVLDNFGYGFERLGYESIQFVPKTAGNFSLHVEYNGTEITGSPFTYNVIPGPISTVDCVGFFGNDTVVFDIFDTIQLNVQLKDEFGNRIMASLKDNAFVDFSVTLNDSQGQTYSPDANLTVQNDTGYETIALDIRKADVYLLDVSKDGTNIQGSPFSFTVMPGPLSAPNCQAFWLSDTQEIKAGKQASVEVLLMDAYNNSVNSYLDLAVYFTSTRRTIENANITYSKQSGHQIITFIITTMGEFSLHVTHSKIGELVGSPLNFTVIPGNISPSRCTGNWLDNDNTFEARQSGALKITLRDVYSNMINASRGDAKYLKYIGLVKLENFQGNTSIELSVAEDETNTYKIVTINPIVSGRCFLYLYINKTNIVGSPFLFTLNSGSMYAPNCIGSWQNNTNNFKVGQKVVLIVVLKDNSNTTILPTPETSLTVSVTDPNETIMPITPDIRHDTSVGYVAIVFNAATKGVFFLHVGDLSSEIKGSPFMFTIT